MSDAIVENIDGLGGSERGLQRSERSERSERKFGGSPGSSSRAMRGILCVGAPWRGSERWAQSRRGAAGYIYIEMKLDKLSECAGSCDN